MTDQELDDVRARVEAIARPLTLYALAVLFVNRTADDTARGRGTSR